MTDAFDYLETRDDADEMIAEFGRAVSFRRNAMSGTAFDPTLTPTDYATVGVKIEFTLKQMRSGTVLATDERWLVAAGPLATVGITDMQPPDLLVVGGVERQIVLATLIAPAGTVVLFDCQCRK